MNSTKLLCIVLTLFGVVALVTEAAPNWLSASKGRWTRVGNGLPQFYTYNCMWSWQQEIFISITNTPSFLNITTNRTENFSGTYKLDNDWVWRRISTLRLCPSCDTQSAPFYCYTTSNNQPVRFIPTSFNGTFETLGPQSPLSFRLSDAKYYRGAIYDMNNDAVNEIQLFNLTTRQYSWLGGAKENPIPNIRGGGEWFEITEDDSVYTTSSFSRTVWRYSSRLNVFLNVTFDLDMRNLLGACCGPIGPLYMSRDGKELYIGTEQGVFWFRGTRWQKVLEDGTAEFSRIGNYLFAKSNRYIMPGPVTGIPLRSIPGLPVIAGLPVNQLSFGFGIESPTDDGEVIVALPFAHENNLASGANTTGWIKTGDRYVDAPYILQFYRSTDSEYADQPIQSNNFQIDHATYLGTAGEDTPVGVQILTIGGIKSLVIGLNIVGGSLPSYFPAATDLGFGNASSAGYLLVMRLSDMTITSLYRISQRINSMKLARMNAQKFLIFATQEGVLALNGQTLAVTRQFQSHGGLTYSRAAMDNEGRVAVIHSGGGVALNVTLLGPNDSIWTSRRYPGSGINDIEMLGGVAEPVVFVGGFSQLAVGATTGYQRPNIHVWSTNMETALQDVWCLWCQLSLETIRAQELMADSRISELELSEDGSSLYFISLTAGGNTVFLREPFNLSVSASYLSTLDDFTAPYNIQGAPHLLFYGRVDLATRTIARGQFRLTRLGSGKGNTLDPSFASFAVGPKGDMYIGGRAACCIPARDGDASNADTILRVNCNRVGAYNGGDSYILHVAKEMDYTQFWTSLNAGTAPNAGGGRDCVGVAVDSSQAVALFRAAAGNLTVTGSAIARSNLNASDLYVVVWPHRQSSQTCTAEFLADTLPFVDPDTTYVAPTTQASQDGNSTNVGGIVAGVIVAVLVVGGLAAAGFIFRKRIKKLFVK